MHTSQRSSDSVFSTGSRFAPSRVACGFREGRCADSWGRRRPRRRQPPKRGSVIDRYEAEIRRLLADTPDMKATTILERLRPLGYTSGISILRERVRLLRPRPAREAFLTLDFAPGSAFQVDWADFGFTIPGCPRRVSAFVMAACYSRYLYLEFTLSQAMGTFLRCMERGLDFFGGVAQADIFDGCGSFASARSGVIAAG